MILKRFLTDQAGSVAISASWLSGIFIVILGGGIEVSHNYMRANSMQHAAKTGARIATTISPVSAELSTMTGLESGIDSGDPMPDYKIVCSGKTQSCNRGGFDQTAFNKIFYGKDNDGSCEGTARGRRGMCDLFDDLSPENVTITYEDSGMGRAGNPPSLFPIITITITDVVQDYVFLDFILSDTMETSASAMGEDLK